MSQPCLPVEERADIIRRQNRLRKMKQMLDTEKRNHYNESRRLARQRNKEQKSKAGLLTAEERANIIREQNRLRKMKQMQDPEKRKRHNESIRLARQRKKEEKSKAEQLTAEEKANTIRQQNRLRKMKQMLDPEKRKRHNEIRRLARQRKKEEKSKAGLSKVGETSDYDIPSPKPNCFETNSTVNSSSTTPSEKPKSAKMQWKKLRDNFREALKRQKDSKGGSRCWRYQQQMEFLIPYMQSKNGDLIFDSEKNSAAAAETLEVVPYPEDIVEEDLDNSCSSSQLPRKKRKFPLSYPYLDDKKFEDLSSSSPNLSSGRNPLLEFFNSMYNTTESLPLNLQIQVKKKVFEIVTQAEEEALLLQEQYEKQSKEYDVRDFL